MGHEDVESMASFASVAAMSRQQITVSPTKSAEKSSETCIFQKSLSPKESVPKLSKESRKPAQTHKDKNIFESFEPSKLVERSQGERQIDAEEIETSVKKSHDKALKSHDKVSQSADVSCDNCMQLQTSGDIEQRSNSPAPRSPQSYVEKISKKLLNKSVKRLKKKLRRVKSKKFTRLKKSKYPVSRIRKQQPEENLECYTDVFDSSVRSVCSESEPLPVFDRQKRKHSDSDSSSDETFTKKRKMRTLFR